HFRSVDRRAAAGACRASPIVAHSRSSGRCASRLGTKSQSELFAGYPLASSRSRHSCNRLSRRRSRGGSDPIPNSLFGCISPEGSTYQIRSTRDCDLAIVGLPVDRPEVNIHPLPPVEAVAVLPRGHALAKQQRVSLRQVVDGPLVAHSSGPLM